jgi:fructokinase
MSASSSRRVLCFGEILWDFLPEGLFPGGAPFNVAYHLHRHGLSTQPVSAVGRDLLGEELLRRLLSWKISTDTIAEHSGVSTGYVRAEISVKGDARYHITPDVAWDRIDLNPTCLEAAARCAGVVFGSLALRSAHNRSSLQRLLAALPSDAARIFDVNLRPPHDDLALVRSLAPQATLLKLNAAEAARLAADAPETPGREEADARDLHSTLRTPTICITAGDRGAGLLHEDRWYWEPAQPVKTADTVGAGDSFLAAFLSRWLPPAKTPPADALRHACRIGEWVATQRGATPDYAHAPMAR